MHCSFSVLEGRWTSRPEVRVCRWSAISRMTQEGIRSLKEWVFYTFKTSHAILCQKNFLRSSYDLFNIFFLWEDKSKISFFDPSKILLKKMFSYRRSQVGHPLLEDLSKVFNIYQELAIRSPTVGQLSLTLSKDFYSKKAFGRCCIYSGPLKDSPSVEGF